MSTYKKEVGTAVQNAAGTLSGVVEGQLWYDSTAASFKYQYPTLTTAGSWSTGNNMNTARTQVMGAGTQTQGLAFGGFNLSNVNTGATEFYDGISWTELNDLNTARRDGAGNGTYTSALAYGGAVTAVVGNTESWNGTCWAAVNNLNTARRSVAGAGADNTSALAMGGSPTTAVTESWNGTSWTEVNDMNTARQRVSAFGTQTSALVFGDNVPPGNGALTESWNGTNWTEVNDLNTARGYAGSAGSDNTSGLAIGGETTPGTSVGNTELWGGTSWSEQNDLSSARLALAGAGTTSSALAFGGGEPPTVELALTEEWTGAGAPIGAWSTGGNLNTARRNLEGSGVKSAALVFGGDASGEVTNTESYNGTSWTEVNDLSTARSQMGACGTQTSSLTFGGYTGAAYVANNESWNGTSWTEVADLNNPSAANAGAGTDNTSALSFGGYSPTFTPSPPFASNRTESWNGSSWTSLADMNGVKNGLAGSGVQTSALGSGGFNYSPNITNESESWNGTSWTLISSLNTARYLFGGSGNDNTAGLVWGGAPSAIGNTELWNGATWTEVNDLNTGRQGVSSANGVSNTSSITAGGEESPAVAFSNKTEEWSSSSNTVKTISTS